VAAYKENKMPCYKCSNNKYKYGERGRCQFDTLSSCEAAERAVHARESKGVVMKAEYFQEPLEDCEKTYIEKSQSKPYND
jgi:hypothetical protein